MRRAILERQASDPTLTPGAEEAIARELIAINRELARRVRPMEQLGTLRSGHARQ